jgi:hypothetical protein
MKRVLVPLAVLGVAVAAMALWLATRADPASVAPSPAPPPPAPSAAPPPAPAEAPPAARPPVATPGVTIHESPRGDAPREPLDKPAVYAVGDVIVRDRRGPGAPPITEPIDGTPPGGVFLRNETAARVVNDLRAPAEKCLQDAAAGPQKLSVTMTVEVKNNSATVTGVEGSAPGVEASALAPTLACLRKEMIGARIDATGEADVRSYPITTVYSAQ